MSNFYADIHEARIRKACSRLKKSIPAAAALASAAMLSLAHPPVADANAAFFALVPLLLALRAATPRGGFRLGFAFGLAFRLLSLGWLLALKDNGGPAWLVAFGLVALSAWTALFHGLFGWLAATAWSFARRPELPARTAFRAAAWLSEPILWAGSEYLVGTLLSGFPWNPLAATQTGNLALLSVVSIGGAQMLSALLVAANGGVASLLARIWSDAIAPRFAAASAETAPGRNRRLPRTIPLGFALILLVAAWWRGIDRVRELDRASFAAPCFRIALVHPDAACIFERDDAAVLAANEALRSFTELASATGPDLVVWPETALPGYVPYDSDAAALVRDACGSSGAPLIAGAVEYVPRFTGDKDGLIFNSALFFRPGPVMAGTYRKRHLVPFGEFIPLESKIPALKRLAPTGFSCESGLEPRLFDIANASAATNKATVALSPLICFEDAFPYLARDCAAAGADALVAIANDSWFDGTIEPEQHLRQAVLRAVETGLPAIRATNRGVTAFILPSGRIVRRIGNGRGGGTPGFATAEIGIQPDTRPTPYVRFGDAIFARPCAGYLLALAFVSSVFGKQRQKMSGRNVAAAKNAASAASGLRQ